MAGGTPKHADLGTNLAVAVGERLRSKPCRGSNADERVRFDRTKNWYYPDFFIKCPPYRFHPRGQDALMNPRAVFEVFSSSTEVFDRTAKFDQYKTIAELFDYVLVCNDEVRAEHFRKLSNGNWEQAVFIGATRCCHSATSTSRFRLRGSTRMSKSKRSRYGRWEMLMSLEDWLDADIALTFNHRTFLEALFARAYEWADIELETVQLAFLLFNQFVPLIFGVSDNIHHKALRDLRVEFDGQEVRCGEDKRNWLEGFGKSEPVQAFCGSPTECVEFMLRWLRREWSRPVDLLLWRGTDWQHAQCLLADTRRGLSWSGWKNVPESDLGQPDEVTRVHPLPKP